MKFKELCEKMLVGGFSFELKQEFLKALSDSHVLSYTEHLLLSPEPELRVLVEHHELLLEAIQLEKKSCLRLDDIIDYDKKCLLKNPIILRMVATEIGFAVYELKSVLTKGCNPHQLAALSLLLVEYGQCVEILKASLPKEKNLDDLITSYLVMMASSKIGLMSLEIYEDRSDADIENTLLANCLLSLQVLEEIKVKQIDSIEGLLCSILFGNINKLLMGITTSEDSTRELSKSLGEFVEVHKEVAVKWADMDSKTQAQIKDILSAIRKDILAVVAHAPVSTAVSVSAGAAAAKPEGEGGIDDVSTVFSADATIVHSIETLLTSSVRGVKPADAPAPVEKKPLLEKELRDEGIKIFSARIRALSGSRKTFEIRKCIDWYNGLIAQLKSLGKIDFEKIVLAGIKKITDKLPQEKTHLHDYIKLVEGFTTTIGDHRRQLSDDSNAVLRKALDNYNAALRGFACSIGRTCNERVKQLTGRSSILVGLYNEMLKEVNQYYLDATLNVHNILAIIKKFLQIEEGLVHKEVANIFSFIDKLYDLTCCSSRLMYEEQLLRASSDEDKAILYDQYIKEIDHIREDVQASKKQLDKITETQDRLALLEDDEVKGEEEHSLDPTTIVYAGSYPTPIRASGQLTGTLAPSADPRTMMCAGSFPPPAFLLRTFSPGAPDTLSVGYTSAANSPGAPDTLSVGYTSAAQSPEASGGLGVRSLGVSRTSAFSSIVRRPLFPAPAPAAAATSIEADVSTPRPGV